MGATSDDDGRRVSWGTYVDDWRQRYDPDEVSCAEAARDRARLEKRFGIKFQEADPATDYFLGANRTSLRRGAATLKAQTYIELTVKRYLGGLDKLDEHPASWTYTPSDPAMMADWEHVVATRPKASEELRARYGSLFGALLHASKYRPEILATLGLCGTCLTFPDEAMYKWLLRTLVYLGRTRKQGISYSNKGDGAHELRAYADSNWSTTRSTTGYVIMLANGPIAAASKRQHCITMSSCEAELVALSDLAIELLYIIGTVVFLGYKIRKAIPVYTDNKGAYDLCHRFSSAQHSRHVERRLFKMRELRGADVVTVTHMPGTENPADLFTKILTRATFEKHRATVCNSAAELADPLPPATSSVSHAAASSPRDGTGAP